MNPPAADATLLPALTAWIRGERRAVAAALYGSRARGADAPGAPDGFSDYDLHLITDEPRYFEGLAWERALPGQGFRFRAVRRAVGGVAKLTIIFATGELEIVLLPARGLRLARIALRLGLHRRLPAVQRGLNVLATGLRGGYRFLKGEREWEAFYARVVAELPGLRLPDDEVRRLADVFVCDLQCILQWIQRGELSAAQHGLHVRLAETNFALIRELRLRRGQPVPSFEVGRRVEALLAPAELGWVRVETRLQADELRQAAWRAYDGLCGLMGELAPDWAPPGVVIASLGRVGKS